MKCRKKKDKLSLKEQVAIACFMESVPKLIELWKQHEEYPCLTFDAYLTRVYEYKKQNKSPPIDEERRNEE